MFLCTVFTKVGQRGGKPKRILYDGDVVGHQGDFLLIVFFSQDLLLTLSRMLFFSRISVCWSRI